MPEVITPVVDRDDAFFWENARSGRLVARACAGCGRLQHPPTPMCPACGALDWEVRELTGRGTVHSWIVSRHPTRPDDAPRIVALVQLEEGIRLVTNLQDVAVPEATVGLPVEVVFLEVDGTVLPQFRPRTEVS
jgi:hypothetical protein